MAHQTRPVAAAQSGGAPQPRAYCAAVRAAVPLETRAAAGRRGAQAVAAARAAGAAGALEAAERAGPPRVAEADARAVHLVGGGGALVLWCLRDGMPFIGQNK
jgi:hypothetical protein